MRTFTFLVLVVLFVCGALKYYYTKFEFDKQLKAIGNPTYFFMLPNLISVYYDLLDIGQFSPFHYHESIKSCDFILKNVFFIEQDATKAASYAITIKMAYNNTLNHLKKITDSSFMPSDRRIREKISVACELVRSILLDYLRSVYRNYKIPMERGKPGYDLFDTKKEDTFFHVNVDENLIRI